MKVFKTLIAVTTLIFAAGVAQAATEYLRFTGNIDNSYSSIFSYGYDASLGFTPGQAVYFDFKIDTNLNAAGHPDSSYQDSFAVTYLAGSVAGPNVTYGTTNNYPEGLTTDLFVVSSLQVGTAAYGDQYGDTSIDAWGVGSSVSLMNYGDSSFNIIGSLKLTYRGATLPPSNVPIPAALWLFISGLGSPFLLRRKLKAI
jgi:hypothetical protein